MTDLTGYVTINSKDAWTEYFAFLCEDKMDDNFNFEELQKPLEMKEYTTVEFRERDGEELPDELPSPRYKARDVTLYIAVYASTLSEYNTRRAAFMEAIRAGWVNLKVKDLPATYRFYYKGTTDAKVITDVTGATIGRWKVKFREPKPGV
ncbi:MAG: hypothetical protein LUH50_00425 [Bacteroides intestinalis]|nr:hypothetical protein [Bacteroides intestinalis]